MNYMETLETNTKVTSIILEKELYSKSTILKSCYKFTDVAYITVKTDIINGISYYKIYFQEKNSLENIELKGNFMNELLDQELRTIILSETGKVRDTIITRALLSGQSNDN